MQEHLALGVAAGPAVAEQADVCRPDRVQGGKGGRERLVHPPPVGRAQLRAAGVGEDAPLHVSHMPVMQRQMCKLDCAGWQVGQTESGLLASNPAPQASIGAVPVGQYCVLFAGILWWYFCKGCC